MKILKIKMLILDVDGTMTDNGIYIDENGIESKRYNAKDGVGTVSYTHLTLPTNREV